MSAGAQDPAGIQAGEGLPLKRFLTVLVPFAFSYFLSYLYRTINAVISQDLVRDLDLGPADLGLLTSAYLLAFALFQLPLGILLDRYGPRRVQALLLLVAACGSGLFAVAGGIEALVLGRALIGLGVSACLMAGIKAFVQWFPLSRLATMNGLLLAAGGIGAFSSALPVEAALQYTDWRGVFAGVAAITVLCAALVFFMVPDRPASESGESWRDLLGGFATVFASGAFWRVGIPFMTVQGTFMAVQGLWIAPWLRDVGGYEQTGAMLAWLAVVMTFGFAFWGGVTDRLARYGIANLSVVKAGLAASALVFALITLGVTSAVPLLIAAFALTSTIGTTVVYPIVSKQFPARLAGRVNTALNLLLFVWAFCLQWGIGAVIGLWPVEDGHYALDAYRAAFGLCLALELAALALLFRRHG